MKKIIRLTEQDLTKIVRRVINEADTKVPGCVKGDCKNGYGEINNDRGDSYKGNFKNGKYNGYGVLKLKTGEIYKGQFTDGGYGTFTNKQGRVFTGLWEWFPLIGLLYRKPYETQNKQYGAKFHWELENIKKDQTVDTKKCKKPDVDYFPNWVSASFDKNYKYTYNGWNPNDNLGNTTGDCWWAKNVKNGKLFNLTDLAKTNPKIQKSIDILNKEHFNKYDVQ